jgi:hypothetical protein
VNAVVLRARLVCALGLARLLRLPWPVLSVALSAVLFSGLLSLQPSARAPLTGNAALGNGSNGASACAAPCPCPARAAFSAGRLREYGATLVSGCASDRAPAFFEHALVDKNCPRFVAALQDTGAGVGHRVREWSTGLWVARLFNLTLVHVSLDVGGREHGSAAGWDDFLGMTWGENGLDLLEVRRRIPAIKEVLFPRLGHWGVPNEKALSVFAPVIAENAGCNVIFLVRGDESPKDSSPLTRAALAWKFAAASALALRAGAAPPLVFDARAVNVAVHYRVGDMTPTPENVLGIITFAYVLPALRRAGVRAPVHVHVFSDGPRELPFFDAEFAKADRTASALVKHGDLSARPTFWNFANADIFVGSLSGFSWMVGLFATRPFALLQHGDTNQFHEYCADADRSAGCCWVWAECEASALERLDAAAQRIAASEACGHIGDAHALVDGRWALDLEQAEAQLECG